MKDLKKYVTNENICMSNNYMKKLSISLVIREIKIKVRMIYSLELLKLKKTIINFDKYMKQLHFSYIASKDANCYSH